MKRDGFQPTATSYLCGDHFLPEMFIDDTVEGRIRKRLKVDAVPTGQ